MGTTRWLRNILVSQGFRQLTEDVLAKHICSQDAIYDINHLPFRTGIWLQSAWGQGLGGVACWFLWGSPARHLNTEMVRRCHPDAVLPWTPSALDSTLALSYVPSENCSAPLPPRCACPEAHPACPLHAWEGPGLSHCDTKLSPASPFLSSQSPMCPSPRACWRCCLVSLAPVLCSVFPHLLPSLFSSFRCLYLISSPLQHKWIDGEK